MRTPTRDALLGAALLLSACAPRPLSTLSSPAERFDVLVRGGVVVDGTGQPRYRADVGVRDGRIIRVGDLSSSRAAVEIDASGLFVAPGFINLHSHASAGALPRAANMLTQGVTTEILNPDGGGPLDVAQQLRGLEAAGLAVNVGAYAGFNTVWSRVVGPDDVRPTADQIAEMQKLVTDNLGRGAWGVSAGLDYKPAYFARVEEVVSVLEPARPWRTHFTNHDRLAPETGYSSRAGVAETLEIGEAAGLVPVVTHMKVQGHEQGLAPAVLEGMQAGAASGRYAAADVYPYLAGQTSLAALIIPGWAQEGGRSAMLDRLRDPALRARIAGEADEAMRARFGGPEGVYLPGARRELVDLMREMQLSSGGEAVIRILEEGSPGAILRFGSESDLIAILQHPTASIACDCGASAGGASHPRAFGTYPRVLGRYVRERGVLTWEDAIRKMTGLPAATLGMVERGFLVPGMAADLVVFDPETVVDHATFEDPTAPSQGIRHVLVNGRVALRDGEPTGERGGGALFRAAHMPSRPMSTGLDRRVAAQGRVLAHATQEGAGQADVAFEVSQRAADRRAAGFLTFRDALTGTEATARELGILQTAEGWASFTGRATLTPSGQERTFVVIVVESDPFAAGRPSIHVEIDGLPAVSGTLADAPEITATPPSPGP